MHLTSNAFAILDSGVTNEVVYNCPNDRGVFVLVKGIGSPSISKLETVSIAKAASDDELQIIHTELGLRKE